jgi:glycosyltransferase involved in cell wall biosynthesis
MRVLQFGTHSEECGIAKYQEQFIEGMSGMDGFYTEYFPHSPNQTKHMSAREFKVVRRELKKQMKEFDILHIQHELSFFKHNELEEIVDLFARTKKKVVVTVHTAPHAWYRRAKLGGLGPRSFAHYARMKLSSRQFLKRFVEPLNKVDLIIVHNDQTKKSLIELGVKHDKFKKVSIPVPKLGEIPESKEISTLLKSSKDDVIYCTVGFLSKMKGITDAVKALIYLPDNYKLAIIGGNHPDTLEGHYYDEVCDLINDLNLKDRVYITGYVKEDTRLNALISECDICVFPYDPAYYSYVSSASLNNAFANHKPAIAYPTKTFLEVDQQIEAIKLCRSDNYYELAREIKNLDLEKAKANSRKYADMYAYDKEAADFLDVYKGLIV